MLSTGADIADLSLPLGTDMTIGLRLIGTDKDKEFAM